MERGPGGADTPTVPQPRVVLRPLHEADAPAVLAAFASDPEMQRQGTVTTLAEARRYVAGLTQPGGSQRPFAVATDDALVGLICVSVDSVNRNGWFWYWMGAGARGRGWAKRAAASVANWALTSGGLERLELGHRTNNPASGAVALAAGFVQEGLEREKFLVNGVRIDVVTYGRVRSDPAPDVEPLPLIGAGS